MSDDGGDADATGEADATQILADLTPYIVQCSEAEFDMKRVIGKGGYGEVYCAVHRKSGRVCAVKKLFLERLTGQNLVYFCREVMILANCHNFFLLPFCGFSPVTPYAIVTEYVARGCLFDALRHKPGTPNLSLVNKFMIALGIARGMMSLHRQQIIHRDLKSLNVLLDEDLLPKICDFGIARFLDENAPEAVTREIGTPNWQAPESLVSDRYTNKVDVYSFAMIVWELLTEDVPFKDKKGYWFYVAVAQNNERPALPMGTPMGLKSLIGACWHKDPEKRPTFAQVVYKLCQGQVNFGSPIQSEIEAHLRRFPFSRDELQDMTTTGGPGFSEPFQNVIRDVPGWDAAAYAVPEGEESAVEAHNEPLGGPAAPAMATVPGARKSDSGPSEEESGPAPASPPPAAPVAPGAGRLPLIVRSLGQDLENITEETAHDLFRNIFAQVPDLNPDVRAGVIQQLSLCAASGRFTGTMIECGVMSILQFAVPKEYEANVRFLIALTRQQPTLVTTTMVCDVCDAAPASSEEAKKVVKLWSVLWSVRDRLADPVAILGVFPVQQQKMGASEGSVRLAHFMSRDKRFGAHRDFLAQILGRGTLSKDPAVAKEACAGLCWLEDLALKDLPLAELLESPVKDCAGPVVARMKEVPPSTRLLQGLLGSGKLARISAIVLCRMAKTERGCELLANCRQWMVPGSFDLDDAFRVFACVCLSAPSRKVLTSAPEIGSFLEWVAREGTAEHLEQVVPFIRRLPPNAPFVTQLGRTTFFEHFMKRAIAAGTGIVRENAILLVDALARVGWSDSFEHFVRALPTFFAETGKGVAQKALVAALAVAAQVSGKDPLGKELLRRYSTEVSEALARVELDPQYAKYRGTLMSLMQS